MTVVSLVLDSLTAVCLFVDKENMIVVCQVPMENMTVVCQVMASLMLVSLFLGKKMTSFSN
jgi:hypothetical protein